MKMQIIAPEGIRFEGETDSITFPGVCGSFDVWPHHAPLIAALTEGSIFYRRAGEKGEEEQKIQSGFVEIKEDIVTVCVE